MQGTYEGLGTSRDEAVEVPARARAGSTEQREAGPMRAGGWAGIGMGTLQVLLPGVVARSVGLGGSRNARLAIRALGAAELLAGMAVLSATRRRPAVTTGEAIAISASTTVNGGVPEVYGFWRDLPKLSRFLPNVEAVEVLDHQRSRWTVRIARKSLTWEARITRDEVNRLIAWETFQSAELVHLGEVRFVAAPGRGTEVQVTVEVSPPGGVAGRALARLAQALPGQQLLNDLRRLKQAIEIGEVIQSDASRHRGRHPARPSEGRR